MGRLVFVREVCDCLQRFKTIFHPVLDRYELSSPDNFLQDRESEPRFTGPPPVRGGYDTGPPRGGFGGGYGGGGGYSGNAPPGGGRQIFVNNVRIHFHLTNSPPHSSDY